MDPSITNAAVLKIFLRGSKRFFLAALFFSLTSILFELLLPQIVRFTVDAVLSSKYSDLPDTLPLLGNVQKLAEFTARHLWLAGVAVLLTGLGMACCRFAFEVFNAMGAETLIRTMRDNLFRHLQNLPFVWHTKHQTGDIIQRCTADVMMVKNFLSDQLTSFFRTIAFISLALFFMFQMNATLAVIAAMMIPIIVLYSFSFHKLIGSRFFQCDVNEGILSTIVQENLTGVRVIRAFGRESFELEKFRKQNEVFTCLWMKLGKVLSVFWMCGDLLAILQILTIIMVGIFLAEQDKLTSGEFIAFVSYNVMLEFPVRHLGRMLSEMSKAGISMQRIREIMAAQVEQDPPNALMPPMNRDIAFNHVSFAYPGCDPLIRDVSFRIKQGTFFGILGSIGAGKSTLVHLLCRLYDLEPDNGTITVGGVNIRDISLDYLHRNISIVMQEPFLFSRTLKENIAITRDEIDMEDVREAARTACLEESIETFADGFDTLVGERGVTLSGGQKQRTAIARMIVQHAPIMIFDDSLSAVDAETDAMIRAAIREKLRGTTVILISHRIATLMEADSIIVLSRGQIAESGTHAELMKSNGIYRKNYEMQMNRSAAAAEVQP